jgi:hypothetical protein
MTSSAVAAPIVWMVGASVLSSMAAVAIGGTEYAPEIVLGMLGPLVSAVATWQIIERAHAVAPERLTNAMITAFGIKMILFAAYVLVVLVALHRRPVPFAASFTIYYVALHVAETVLLKRRLADRAPQARRND